MSLDIQRWAEKITSDTFYLWKNKTIWKPGFKVFYSPVYFKPKIIIVGHNPGGDERSFVEDKIRYEKVILLYHFNTNMFIIITQ